MPNLFTKIRENLVNKPSKKRMITFYEDNLFFSGKYFLGPFK